VKPTGWSAKEIAMQSLGAAQDGLSRRELLRGLALAAGTLGAAGVLAACDAGRGGAAGRPAASGSLRALTDGLPRLEIRNTERQLPVQRSRFAFALSQGPGRPVEGAAPRVWLARDRTSAALGPFQTRWLRLDAYQRTHDRSPRGDLRGFYVADIDLPEQPGDWLAVAIVELGSRRAAGHGSVPVVRQLPVPIGLEAVSGRTPVATGPGQAAKVCTRTPACPLHGVSLDRALRSGRPTVLAFASPALCGDGMCAPVVDELMLAAERVGDKANFIHLEVYPQRDPDRPAPLYRAWGLRSEPWTVVIGPDGHIRARSEGPVAAAEITALVRTVL
jgi:hypothetical protein